MNKYEEALDTVTDWFEEHYETFNGKKTLVRQRHINDKYKEAVIVLWKLVKRFEDKMEDKKMDNCKRSEAKMLPEETYIDFGIAPYAIVDILLMLDNEGIKHFFITQEDWDLHIRIPKRELEEISHRDKVPSDFKGECCVGEVK